MNIKTTSKEHREHIFLTSYILQNVFGFYHLGFCSFFFFYGWYTVGICMFVRVMQAQKIIIAFISSSLLINYTVKIWYLKTSTYWIVWICQKKIDEGHFSLLYFTLITLLKSWHFDDPKKFDNEVYFKKLTFFIRHMTTLKSNSSKNIT